jgi:hypothetical protein
MIILPLVSEKEIEVMKVINIEPVVQRVAPLKIRSIA